MSLSSLKMMYQNFNWRFWTDDGMRKQVGDDDGTGELESDPHYREMLKVKELLLLLILFLGPNRSFFFFFLQYPDAPNSWYIVTLMASIITALVIIYKTDSTLPW